MAHFYADILRNGKKSTKSTLCGYKEDGLTGHIRGWDLGGKVEVSHRDGEDWVSLYVTSGSDGIGEPFVHDVLVWAGTRESYLALVVATTL